jgi:two-component system, chemotaxis family, protein-glutamate methylesterase/glutaminase
MIKVLVIDDSALARRLLGRALADESDIEVFFARNGVEGLAQLKAVNPDVITLDIQMPQMDGLACLDQLILELPRPVLMVSSLTREGADMTLEALQRGAVDFVAKPDGVVSLQMDVFAPLFVAKVRAAAAVKLKRTLRLRERIQHRLRGSVPSRGGERRAPVEARESRDRLVLVGASTGGPPALEALLAPLPATFPWPIIIAQHIPASFTGALARRLDRLCAIAVEEVAQPTALNPGRVYIGRGDADVVVTRLKGKLAVMSTPSDIGYTWHPSVDRLVTSALDHIAPAKLIGILMTGMGNDGAGAMTRLRALGGATIAEAEETAVVWGMPGELVKAGGAEWVLPLPEIAGQLRKLTPVDAADPK